MRLVNLEGEPYAIGETAIYRYRSAAKAVAASPPAAGPALLADRQRRIVSAQRRPPVDRLLRSRGLDIVDANLERAVHHEDDALLLHQSNRGRWRRRRTRCATANGLVLFDSAGTPRQIMGHAKTACFRIMSTDVASRDGGWWPPLRRASCTCGPRWRSQPLRASTAREQSRVHRGGAGSQIVAGTPRRRIVCWTTIRCAPTIRPPTRHLKHNWITSLVRVGDEWFAGTYGAGVLRLDPHGEWHSFADLKRTASW